MKIAIQSDLHFEGHADDGGCIANEIGLADVLIVAGDLSNCFKLESALRILCDRFPEVVFVIGNHDLWGGSFAQAREVLHAASDRLGNLHVLDNSIYTVGGVRILGATMFFANNPTNILNEKFMSDFELTINYRRDVYSENEAAQSFLYGHVQPGDIVVTHHLPSYKSVASRYERSALNCFFVCDMESVMVSRRPSVWIHGHTHTSFDYMLHETRIIANPFGYAFDVNPNWDSDKSIFVT